MTKSDCDEKDDHIREIVRQILREYDSEVQRRFDLKADQKVCENTHESEGDKMAEIRSLFKWIVGIELAIGTIMAGAIGAIWIEFLHHIEKS